MIGEKNRYVSILKQKSGELKGVRDLAPDVWDRWNPLFEIMAEEDSDEFVADTVGKLTVACRQGTILFLDFDAVEFLSAAKIEDVMNQLGQAGLVPVPVVSLSSTANMLTAARNYIFQAGNPAAVRIFFRELNGGSGGALNGLIQQVGLNVTDSHLFIDLEFLDANLVPTVAVAFPVIAAQIPQLSSWSSVTIAGTGYPRLLDIPSASNAELPRTEWEFFNTIRGAFAPQTRRLDFGDYAVTNPELVEDFDPRRMQVSPKIIYTTTNSWIAYKGRSSRGRGWEQTRPMCQALSQNSAFLGAAFSAGDRFILDCAGGTAGPGNSATWKTVGTNHHVTFVAAQVATTL